MSRPKRSSKAVEKAETRVPSLKSIDPLLDLGNGKTLPLYLAAIAATKLLLEQYNTKLSELDGLLNGLTASEDGLDALSEEMLSGVGSKFGFDSTEYEKAGGTRKSERKQPKRKAKTT